MFKLFSTKDLDEAKIEIVYDGQKTGAVITIAGPEHARARAAVAEFDRKRRQYKRRTGRDLADDNEEARAVTIDALVARTLGWEGFADDAGKPIPCTEENVREAYTSLRWLRSQVLGAMADEENFTSRSASGSSTTPARSFD